MLIEGNHSKQRPRVIDYEIEKNQAILDQRRYEERLRHIKLTVEEAPAFQGSPEFIKKIANTLYDYGKTNYNYDETTGELKLFRFIDGHLKNRFVSGLDDNSGIEFANYIERINGICKKLYEKGIADVHAMVEADKTHGNKLDSDIDKVKKHHSDIRAEQTLIQAQKARPVRVYNDAQKAKGLHWQTFSEEDLARSKDNLLSKKIELKKQIKGFEKEIAKLDADIKPHSEKVAELEAKLQTDLKEQEFKDIRLSKEYHEAQVEKLQNKMIPLFEQLHKLKSHIDEIDRQLPLLDVLLRKFEFMKDVQTNFPRRRERFLFNVQKHLRDREELEAFRSGLNRRWKDLTNDEQDLIGPLGLRCDSKIYFF